MKIISLHRKQEFLLKKASRGDRESQQEIFDAFSPKMLGVCRKYVKDIHHAEDLMLQGFLKTFTNLHKFKNEGSLEGWIRRIMVNTCISYLQKAKKIEFVNEEYAFNEHSTYNYENTSVEDIQRLIDTLPKGYKLVFNLYAIEGYKHSEIAKKLSITESTSKSQLFKARKWLQTNYIKMNKIRNGSE